ncbi:selenoneine biosynthesis selenosugar synthase SenB [Massilia niabensis]|uniref:Selenoneine biosynthesis selenosugar synthase SenB n=1 Tax=Massilia niabensis TaxID=544910 RepID=A0ABW0L163_9BURK
MTLPRITIVSPASARDNNGNWQTASRWAHFLRGPCMVEVSGNWTADTGPAAAPDLLIALHARRSAASLAAFTNAFPERPTILVLTGTDLYRDIDTSHEARASLERASALVVLQEAALARLPAPLRAKAHVIYQSAPMLAPTGDGPGERHLDICMIGHLRPEKDPLTFMRSAALVTNPRVRLLHIGGSLDPALEAAARATATANTRYGWLGSLPHAQTRARLAGSHAMVIASTMEGGANVIIEAVTSGVPVLASDIEGNRGMLGMDYAGYFPPGDAAALAQLIDRCAGDAAFDAQLRAQCAARAPLFAPAAEQAALCDLVDNLLDKLPDKL